MRVLLRLVLAALLLSGCATQEMRQQRDDVLARAAHPVLCQKGDECEMKWSRVLQWLDAHSHWKLRNVTDAIVTTEGPLDTEYPAFSIQKVPKGDGRYEILFKAWCAKGTSLAVALLGCEPDEWELMADFVEFVNQPIPQPTAARRNVP